MTITLDDVRQITGLQVDGLYFDVKKISDLGLAADLVSTSVGIEKVEVLEEFRLKSKQVALRMQWIKEKL